MCGISGVFEYATHAPVARHEMNAMLEAIRHRGPDDGGVHIDDDVGIGMRRLSIIDVAGGIQPMWNEDRSIVVVFNGEIYNYRELHQWLRQRGHTFATASDTEVIVHLYEELGDACVQQLRGMFAFAVWDVRQRRLFIARDRLGIKPLYYRNDGGRLVFGSEIKALLEHHAVEPCIDLEALNNFLSLKYVPAPQTMFAGVLALPPGHTLTCTRRDGVTVRRYWDLSFDAQGNSHRSEREYAEELEFLLRESVRLHLVSDVPFGAFLSGGIDSSTIVALMSSVLNTPVKTFSVGFEGDGEQCSELPFARLVADQYETDHHEVFVSARHFTELAEHVVWHLDQPIADDASLANYMVARLAARHVKMVLTGEGGDELFGGYARHAGDRLSPLFRHVPTSVKTLTLDVVSRVPGMRRQKIALHALCQPDETSRLVNWFPLFNPKMKAALLSDDLLAAVDRHSHERVFATHLARTDAVDPLSRMLYLDTTLWLPDDLLARGDKTSMAASLEARVPLLDTPLVEFAARLPSHLKVNGLARKYLLKQVTRAWLPREIVTRPKKGFPMPLSIWFRRDARSFVRDLLSPAVLRRRGLFRPSYVQRLIEENESGSADHGSLLWGLLSVELWHRAFLDSPRAAARAV